MSGADGSAAQGGWAYNIYDVNPAHGLVPSLGVNTFNASLSGTRGQAGERNF